MSTTTFSFGSVVDHNGGVRFRVWAPDAKTVELFLYKEGAYSARSDFAATKENGSRIPMQRSKSNDNVDNGLWEVVVAEARAGSLYKYFVDGNGPFPDPVSRFQPFGVHDPSQVVDPRTFTWTDQQWTALKSKESMQDYKSLAIYELHVGTFTPEGTYAAVEKQLPYLKELGIDAIELLPLADFPGARNWGYDGVCLYAPARCYGTPDELRHFINEAHSIGLNVILDCVYNHLGPDGNYLGCYSPYYFTQRHTTPWGPAPNIDLSLSVDEGKEQVKESKTDTKYEVAHAKQVRNFLIENALHWIEEYHFDGFRLDATHALIDNSSPHFLQELTQRCNSNSMKKHIVIYAEDDRNSTTLIEEPPNGYGLSGCWADDFHHHVRVMLAGDNESYFANFTGSIEDLADTIRKGWFYCGQKKLTEDETRGTDPTSIVHMSKFVYCIQNHDQVGNRAMGERLHHQIPLPAYKAASTLLLVIPETPLLFQGQEWACTSPFQFFTDHKPDLGKLVTEGRRKEFAKFSAFNDPKLREKIPDPQAESTFRNSCLKHEEKQSNPHSSILNYYKFLLKVRRDEKAFSNVTRSAVRVATWSQCAVVARKAGAQDRSTIVTVINFKGESTVNLAAVASVEEFIGMGKLTQRVIGISSDAPFCEQEEQQPNITLTDSGFEIKFHMPGAVILRVTNS